MLYPINEIFYTLQGEATFAGLPSVFVRLQGCDVGCAFCDTKHTWKLGSENVISKEEVLAKLNDSEKYANFTVDNLLQEIKKYKNCRHVVFTGGEPGIFNLSEIMNILENQGYVTQIETSATEELNISNNTWVTVSPKINMPGHKTLKPTAVYRANEIKMPIGRIEDVEKLKNFLFEYNINDKPIWLQPISCNKKATQICVDVALQNNWRVSIQIHKFLEIR